MNGVKFYFHDSPAKDAGDFSLISLNAISACAYNDFERERMFAPVSQRWGKTMVVKLMNIFFIFAGEMCLHIAAAGDRVELVRLLLRLGADLEAREALSGRTALHLAVERGCRSVILFLLTECQPSMDAPTYAGITAYQIAACLDEQLAMELVRKGATPLPQPESDSDASDDDSDESINPAFLSTLNRTRQNPIGVRV